MPCMHLDQVDEGEKHRQRRRQLLFLRLADHEFLQVRRHKGLFLCPKSRDGPKIEVYE